MGSYGEEIHEMTEMRALAMGQYGHNNQPCHHLLYLFALLGEPSSTYSAVRMVLERAYGRDFYAGDEDNGEQGAWYVLSSLGLYSTKFTPGTTEVKSIIILIIIIIIIIDPSDSCSLTVAIAFVSDGWSIESIVSDGLVLISSCIYLSINQYVAVRVGQSGVQACPHQQSRSSSGADPPKVQPPLWSLYAREVSIQCGYGCSEGVAVEHRIDGDQRIQESPSVHRDQC